MSMDGVKTNMLEKSDYLVQKQVEALLSDPFAANELAKDVASEIASYIEGKSNIKGEIIYSAFGNPIFRQMIMAILPSEMDPWETRGKAV